MGKKWKRVALSCSQHGYQQSAGTMSESRWQPFYIFRIIAAPSTLPVGSLPGVFWCETFRCEKCMYVCENIWTWPDIIPTGEKKNMTHVLKIEACLPISQLPQHDKWPFFHFPEWPAQAVSIQETTDLRDIALVTALEPLWQNYSSGVQNNSSRHKSCHSDTILLWSQNMTVQAAHRDPNKHDISLYLTCISVMQNVNFDRASVI